MLSVFSVVQIPDLFDDGARRWKRRNAQLLLDHADPVIVIPDGVNPSFIEREQGQEMANQLLTIHSSGRRMTWQQRQSTRHMERRSSRSTARIRKAWPTRSSIWLRRY